MKALIISFTILLVAGAGLALQCFECNSKDDSACSDKFLSDSRAVRDAYLVMCNETGGIEGDQPPFCRKTKHHLYFTGEVRVLRDCGYERRTKYDCYQNRAEDYVVDVCQCDKEECNGAPSRTPFTPLIVLLIPFVARFL